MLQFIRKIDGFANSEGFAYALHRGNHVSPDDSDSGGRTVAAGDQLGHYRIDAVIGAGGMSDRIAEERDVQAYSVPNVRPLAPRLVGNKLFYLSSQGGGDGKWIATSGIDNKGQGLFKIPVDGGEPVRLVAGGALNPVWSPDGMIIAYQGANVGSREPLKAIAADGTPIDLPPILLSAGGQRLRFLPDGMSIVYGQPVLHGQNYWLLDLATKKTRQLTRFSNTASMRTFDITPDGKQIIFGRLRDNSDIVLIELPKAKRWSPGAEWRISGHAMAN